MQSSAVRAPRLLLALWLAAVAPEALAAQTLPLDTAVHVGTLRNGVRYYVRRNAEPRARAEMRLVVAAGSLVETDAERGFAHLVEHMAFAGTRSFTGRSLLDSLESIGVRFGTDVNAHTTHEETVYRLVMPTDDDGAVARGITILREWAAEIVFDSAALATERRVVVEEWRGGLDGADRLAQWRDSAAYAGSGYALRQPMGTLAVVERARVRDVARFYERWYRPALMAVVVVGDVDVDAVTRLIEARFQTLRRMPRPPPLPAAPRAIVRRNGAPAITVTMDSGAVTAALDIHYGDPVHVPHTRSDLRDALVDRMFSIMMERRLRAAYASAGLTVLSTAVTSDDFGRAVSYRRVGLSLDPAAVTEVLVTTCAEIDRAVRDGFDDVERQAASARLVRELVRDSLAAGRTSARYAQAYVQHFVRGQPFMSVQQELALTRELLRSMDSATFQHEAQRWQGEHARLVLARLPGDARDMSRATASIRQALRSRHGTRTARVPATRPSREIRLIDPLPTAGNVVAEHHYEGTSVTEWTLSNGMRVLLKPTAVDGSELLVHAYRAGGWSKSGHERLLAARFAADLVSYSIAEPQSRDEVETLVAGSSVDVRVGITARSAEIRGSAFPRDAGALLRTVYLRMARPRVDSVTTARWRAEMRLRLLAAERDAGSVLEAVLARGSWRDVPASPEIVDAVSASNALSFFREQFGDASQFTVVLVGVFSLDSMRPLVERYLASLPSVGRVGASAGRPADATSPEARVMRVLDEPVAVTYLRFGGSAPDPQVLYLLRTTAELLQMRAVRRLRHELGATYGVDVRVQTGVGADNDYALAIEVRSAPDRADQVKAEVVRLLTALQTDGPTARELDHVLAIQRRNAESDLRSNEFWLEALREAQLRGQNPSERPLGGEGVSRAVLADVLRHAAAMLLDWRRCLEVTLLPRDTSHQGP